MACSSRLWQLLHNYIQEKQTSKRTKTEKERKKEKGKMTNQEGEEKEIENIDQVQLGEK